MKLPALIHAVTLIKNGYDTPYPPLGFCAIAEHQLGNGDAFGLYWPVGHEDCEPIVAETYHDEWHVEPHFSSLERFLEAAGNDDDSLVESPGYADDPASPAAC